MQIVKHYTGNPMLNNALMTVKALAGLSSISELTTEVLKEKLMKVHEDLPYPLVDLNLRFKCYTMLFTKNAHWFQDKKLGRQIYQNLMVKIIDCFNNEGNEICDFTNMRYDKSFSQISNEVFIELGISAEKDLTLNRCWFPLLGSLGSDAQALPMAKYTYNIHPIFIVILQFLPLSALLYKKKILLIDSSNIRLCESYIKENVEEVIRNAKCISSTEPIENVSTYNRCSCVLKMLDIMKESEIDFNSSEINLWSYSNLGLKASCSIDRIPNKLLLKLETLYKKHKNELIDILHNSIYANDFLDRLDSNKEWDGLYPAKNYDGVSVELFESYWEVIGQKKDIEIAKYIAYLISKYKTTDFSKYLEKTDAYDCEVYNYQDDLNKLLLEATGKGEWSFIHQLYIQDNKDTLPIWNTSYKLHKLIHFYYLKNVYSKEYPLILIQDNNLTKFYQWILSLISKESAQNQIVIKNRILGDKDFDSSIFDELFIRHCDEENVSIYTIFPLIHDADGRKLVRGIKSLLRYYFISKDLILEDSLSEPPSVLISDLYKQWFESIDTFVMAYIRYRMHKVINEDKRGEYMKKIFKSVPKEDLREQRIWFKDILDRLNDFGKEGVWDKDTLVYDPLGNYNFSIFIYALRMKLSKVVNEYSKVKIDN